MNTDIRWTQRFENYQKALLLLEQLANQKSKNRAETEGMVQRFEYTFELAWKLMKDYLKEGGLIISLPGECIKEAYAAGMIEAGEVWMEMPDTRNVMAHTYNEENEILLIAEERNDYFKNKWNENFGK
ncbi:MAG TPA: HI0074 family nucleotidyltransferase substrate-binding subunit [Chitinophagaceae bacterium]|nr:HI0074 family nucleotidyltransferase substrate-binding subunit [Chitinophagaceae bacterium]